MPISVASDDLPATVRQGSVVDVWVAPEVAAVGGAKVKAVPVLTDVVVVAVPRASDGLAPQSTRQVIVGVPARPRRRSRYGAGRDVRRSRRRSPGRAEPVAERVTVLLAAGGEAWEAAALRLLDAGGPTVVLKRCVDLADLLASAATGQADVAVVSGDLPGLDADAVMQLLRDDVRCVAVGGPEDALTRIGVVGVVPEDDLAALPEAVGSAGTRELVRRSRARRPSSTPRSPARPGRVVAVHGPAGAPGRTTLAIGLAAEHAHRGEPTVLVDADPHGGAVAQHLGVLDEVSGLLAAARLVNAGSLDAAAFARCRRVVADGLEVLTGLPRPDRWVEARPGVLDAVLDRAREVGDVVVDTGFSLEDDADLGRSISRNQLTLDAVAVGRPGRRRGLGRADRAGPAGPHARRAARRHPRAGHRGGQPDA